MVKIPKAIIFYWLKLSARLFHTSKKICSFSRHLESSVRLWFAVKTCFPLSKFSISIFKTLNFVDQRSLVINSINYDENRLLSSDGNQGKLIRVVSAVSDDVKNINVDLYFRKIFKSCTKRDLRGFYGRLKILQINNLQPVLSVYFLERFKMIKISVANIFCKKVKSSCSKERTVSCSVCAVIHLH